MQNIDISIFQSLYFKIGSILYRNKRKRKWYLRFLVYPLYNHLFPLTVLYSILKPFRTSYQSLRTATSKFLKHTLPELNIHVEAIVTFTIRIGHLTGRYRGRFTRLEDGAQDRPEPQVTYGA